MLKLANEVSKKDRYTFVRYIKMMGEGGKGYGS